MKIILFIFFIFLIQTNSLLETKKTLKLTQYNREFLEMQKNEPQKKQLSNLNTSNILSFQDLIDQFKNPTQKSELKINIIRKRKIPEVESADLEQIVSKKNHKTKDELTKLKSKLVKTHQNIKVQRNQIHSKVKLSSLKENHDIQQIELHKKIKGKSSQKSKYISKIKPKIHQKIFAKKSLQISPSITKLHNQNFNTSKNIQNLQLNTPKNKMNSSEISLQANSTKESEEVKRLDYMPIFVPKIIQQNQNNYTNNNTSNVENINFNSKQTNSTQMNQTQMNSSLKGITPQNLNINDDSLIELEKEENQELLKQNLINFTRFDNLTYNSTLNQYPLDKSISVLQNFNIDSNEQNIEIPELSPEMITDLYRTKNFSLAGFYHNSNILDSLRFAQIDTDSQIKIDVNDPPKDEKQIEGLPKKKVFELIKNQVTIYRENGTIQIVDLPESFTNYDGAVEMVPQLSLYGRHDLKDLKEQLEQGADLQGEPVHISKNMFYDQSPVIFQNMIEDAVTGVTTAKSETDQKKELWQGSPNNFIYDPIQFVDPRTGRAPDPEFEDTIQFDKVGIDTIKASSIDTNIMHTPDVSEMLISNVPNPLKPDFFEQTKTENLIIDKEPHQIQRELGDIRAKVASYNDPIPPLLPISPTRYSLEPKKDIFTKTYSPRINEAEQRIDME